MSLFWCAKCRKVYDWNIYRPIIKRRLCDRHNDEEERSRRINVPQATPEALWTEEDYLHLPQVWPKR